MSLLRRHGIVKSAGSGFSPLDLSDCVGWYDFSQPSQITFYSGTYGIGYSDLAGVNNLTRSNLTPTAGWEYTPNVKNGLGAILPQLNTLYHSTVYSQPNTYFVVCNLPNDILRSTIFDGNASGRNLLQRNSTGLVVRASAGLFDDLGSTAYQNVWAVIYILFNGASSEWQINSASGSINPGTASNAGLNIGATYTDANRYNDYIGEVIMYNADQSGNKDTVMNYLSEKWDISIV